MSLYHTVLSTKLIRYIGANQNTCTRTHECERALPDDAVVDSGSNMRWRAASQVRHTWNIPDASESTTCTSCACALKQRGGSASHTAVARVAMQAFTAHNAHWVHSQQVSVPVDEWKHD